VSRPPAAVERWQGSASDFHGRDVPPIDAVRLWWFEVQRPALVLGSTQPDDVVDRGAAERAGVEVVRRRSGGGAVLLVPGDVTWVDVLLPRTDPRWRNDVGRSFEWLGVAWAGALASLGLELPDLSVHRGGLARTSLSPLVCFAGLGPGEVTVGGRKLVGISQRRTRRHARFQCALLHRWDPDRLVELLALAPEQRSGASRALADVAVGTAALGGSADRVVAGPASGEVVRALAAAVAPPA